METFDETGRCPKSDSEGRSSNVHETQNQLPRNHLLLRLQETEPAEAGNLTVRERVRDRDTESHTFYNPQRMKIFLVGRMSPNQGMAQQEDLFFFRWAKRASTGSMVSGLMNSGHGVPNFYYTISEYTKPTEIQTRNSKQIHQPQTFFIIGSCTHLPSISHLGT